jgi:AraC-like DNA-binding protein
MVAEATWLGFERVQDSGRMTRHCHDRAYAALVLSGSYVEAGDAGRHDVGVGDVLIHGRFESHQNAFGTKGAYILNLPCPQQVSGTIGRVPDPDAIAILAERDPRAAAEMLFAELIAGRAVADDWPDLLARALDRDEVPSLSGWAEEAGLSPASVSRGFARAYGTSPQRFRADRRASRALRAIAAGSSSFTMLAAELGFADQAHMSREVARLSGAPPSRWRQPGQSAFKRFGREDASASFE